MLILDKINGILFRYIQKTPHGYWILDIFLRFYSNMSKPWMPRLLQI